MSNVSDFIEQLPEERRSISIMPRCRTTLQHFEVGKDIVVVLLTKMPGDELSVDDFMSSFENKSGIVKYYIYYFL